ncbi:hypothetical protein ELE36_08775 [Pseudolysobacter antarcticus]|uniref:Uncharacterized protein n=1 Tax=Pseudolysobacter antarcticus TaxID=2511995 RepID=A0A411HJ66_9GAMM|nr:hypothetical protein [Pseudolysobacter antarcticus]QBB70454.1 hypothetical protein ELE36_08775 [Pseudolysobacter antarcticus]
MKAKPESASTAIDASNASRKSARLARIAEFGSVLALAISFLALATGAYQTRLMQSQAKASVWPYISIGYHYALRGTDAGFAWRIDNNGVGPARIESVALSLDDKPKRNWSEVFPVLFGHAEVKAGVSGFNGTVLPPNTNRETTIFAIKIEDLEQAKIFFDAQDRFKMSICYCSVYDECWVAQWLKHQVQPVDRCIVENTVQFQ